MSVSFTLWRRWVALVVLGMGGAVSGLGCQRLSVGEPQVGVSNSAGGELSSRPAPIVAAAGDIACSSVNMAQLNIRLLTQVCQMQQTSDLLLKQPFDAVLALGDLQYSDGTLEEFRGSYERTWGRVKSITRPVPGNHEYYTPGAAGYFQYFGKLAQNPKQGYYSFNLGAWHIVALNSNCEAVGGCELGSPQVQWLKADLAAHPTDCTLAYWHHPRFSSGLHGDDERMDGFWQVLHNAGAEVILTGHDHHYERFAPQTPAAHAAPQSGIRQFVVGTGGAHLRPLAGVQPNSEVRQTHTYGVLKLTLHPQSYEWEFLAIDGQTFTDSGSTACHR